jgi:hypothetical protein
MTSDASHQPTSPLRARMIEDMTVRGFNEQTRQHYVRHVVVRGFHPPLTRHSNRRGCAPLPAAPAAERDAAVEHEQPVEAVYAEFGIPES